MSVFENLCVFMEETWEPASKAPRVRARGMSLEVGGAVAKVILFYICWR